MKKVVSYLSLIAGAALLAVSVQAQSGELSYNYIEGGLTILDPDGGDAEEGFNIRLSGALTDSLYFQGSWDRIELGSGRFSDDVDNFKIGLGFHSALSQRTDWFVEGSYGRIEGFGSDSDGGRLDLGVRTAFANNFEGRFYGGALIGDDDEVIVGGAELLLKFTDQLGLNVGAETEEFDVFVYRANLRLMF